MISKNTSNWLCIFLVIFTIWFLCDRYKSRISKTDQKKNLALFYQNILYYDNVRKMEQIKKIQNLRKNNFKNFQNQYRQNHQDLDLLRPPTFSAI